MISLWIGDRVKIWRACGIMGTKDEEGDDDE